MHFTSSDSSAVLPANYTFTSANAGTHSFTATLKTVGTQTIYATDTVTSSITGSASTTVNSSGASATFLGSDIRHRKATGKTSTAPGLRPRQRRGQHPLLRHRRYSPADNLHLDHHLVRRLAPWRLPAAATASPPSGIPPPVSRSPSISPTVKRTTSPSTRST